MTRPKKKIILKFHEAKQAIAHQPGIIRLVDTTMTTAFGNVWVKIVVAVMLMYSGFFLIGQGRRVDGVIVCVLTLAAIINHTNNKE